MSGTAAFVYDPYTPELQHDPYAVYRRLRDDHPVYHNPDRGFWALSRFDDVWAAVHDTATFSSVVAEANALLPMMLFIDPPRHGELRALVSRAFTPKRISEMEPRVREITRSLLDAAGDERIELLSQLAAPLPSTVIGDLIGVPVAQHAEFREWTESLIETSDDGGDKLATAAANIYGCFSELLDARSRDPQDDLMSALVRAEVDGKRLDRDELLGFCFLLVVAGNDTTTNLILNGAHLLACHPDQQAAVAADPALLAGAIEEMLRYESPTQALPRTTTRPLTLHGTTIPARERVLLLWAAANHDEREFADPERFDVVRPIDRHLAFGHGVHHCLGAALARLEARVAFEELLHRHPAYSLAGEPERVTSHWARAFEALDLELR